MIFYYGLPLDASGKLGAPTPAGWELYDMQSDPFELKNLYDDPAYAPIAADLKKRLRGMKEQHGDTDAPYPELLERLQSA